MIPWYDGIEMNIVTETRLLYAKLVDECQTLFDVLSQAECLRNDCFILPPTLVDQESATAEFIPVEYRNDYHGKVKALGAFTKFKPDIGHSFKAPFRLPGVLQFRAQAADDITPLIDCVNFTKGAIKTLITQSKLNAAEKHDLLRTVAPGSITLLMYRQLSYFSDVKTIGFTWSNKFSTKVKDRVEFIEYLKGSAQNPPSGVTRSEWEPFVQKEIKLISEVKSDTIKIKRPLPAAPMANISFHSEKTKLRHAHLPFIVFSDDTINVKPLNDYLATKSNRADLPGYLINRLYALI